MERFQRIAPITARIMLGLIFTVFGLNGLLHFAPTPAPTPAGAAFLGAMAASHYLIPLIKGTEIIAGIMLLGNRFVAFALVLLAPIVVNIVAFHSYLDPGGRPVAFTVLTLGLGLAWNQRAAYRSLFTSEPSKQRAQVVVDEAVARKQMALT